jgi:hypothetical protein
MLWRAGGSHEHEIIPSSSRANIKWLNVVLDLNGILCICQEKRLMPRGQTYVDNSRPYFGTILYLIGPKVVFICPSCQRLLRKHCNEIELLLPMVLKK